MRRLRAVSAALPARTGRHDGLAYGLWLPAGVPRGGVVILHGAGSAKESHHDFARVLVSSGFAALTFDQRGHGESEGALDGRAVEDVVGMASVLRAEAGAGADGGAGAGAFPLALRGSSMGGCFAIAAAARAGAGAVVAICPAPPDGLVRGLRAGRFSFRADEDSLRALLESLDLFAAVRALRVPLLIMHATGDEQVPVEHSRELIRAARVRASRLADPPGGHHRSIQHDEELQAASVAFIRRALAGAGPTAASRSPRPPRPSP